MKLSDLLQTQPRITLALVEGTADLYEENGDRTGRNAEKYSAALTYVYETSENVGLGLTVECIADLFEKTPFKDTETFMLEWI